MIVYGPNFSDGREVVRIISDFEIGRLILFFFFSFRIQGCTDRHCLSLKYVSFLSLSRASLIIMYLPSYSKSADRPAPHLLWQIGFLSQAPSASTRHHSSRELCWFVELFCRYLHPISTALCSGGGLSGFHFLYSLGEHYYWGDPCPCFLIFTQPPSHWISRRLLTMWLCYLYMLSASRCGGLPQLWNNSHVTHHAVRNSGNSFFLWIQL
jgi:hypothetical protein